ncbi:interleukin-17 receptor E isoform X2 [Melanotaenia boesemani]|uniref:interleukin-17 receptor E isoform X2 n=1 Tax=Melanotaenia boesemani TaxID=1250792 RepID=UPI001C043FCC|nr:interleukin-17 receptor E isoform X2 [Melanotaenia boesemani]
MKSKKIQVRCDGGFPQHSLHSNTSLGLWNLVYYFSKARSWSIFSVTYNTTSTSCNVIYTVPDPRPDFSLSVNKSSKTITVSVDSEDIVNVRLCYKQHPSFCKGLPQQGLQVTKSALLNITYLLPCVCVEVYYTHRDARRHKQCPFQDRGLTDARDILRSSKVTLFNSYLEWKSKCPASSLNISASLCWKQHEHLCIPVLNSTLERENGSNLKFNTSAVDEHPQMCVQFSTQGFRNVSCLFKEDGKHKSWEAYIEPGMKSILVHLTSSSVATFSAQLCILTEWECTPTGPIHSVTTEVDASEKNINVPVHVLSKKPCVQVWQSKPALKGRRIMCPDFTHNRWGLCAVAVFIFATIVTVFGLSIHHVTKRGAEGWLTIQKPLLLVCSSDESTHVTATSALASLLQGELGATVHTALWAQNSQRQAGGGAGVADLGPLPWLYGQWEAVCKAHGKVLIIWSPEAKRTYEKCQVVRAKMGKNERNKDNFRKASLKREKVQLKKEEDSVTNGRREGKCKEKDIFVKSCDEKDRYSRKEHTGVIEPVFMAAVASLEVSLQECKGQGVAIVYFQGFCQSRDIPKSLRSAPRYCLPQDLCGLIQELGEVRKGAKTAEFSWQCWSRLLSKVLSIWLARQLARRLQTLLPQMQTQHLSSITSSKKMTSDQTQSRLKSLQTARSGTEEQELLQGSPWRTEKL